MEANAPSAAPPSATPPRAPTLAQAMIPLTFLVVSLGCAVYLYGDDAIFGPVQVALFLSAAVAGQVGYKNGHSIADVSKAGVDSVASAMGAIFILLAVGALIGTWNMSGTIATHLGLGDPHPQPGLLLRHRGGHLCGHRAGDRQLLDRHGHDGRGADRGLRGAWDSTRPSRRVR